MKVIRAFPPNWPEIAKHFPVKGKQGILYAYGDRLYNPSGVQVTPWIMAHEMEHGRRQEDEGQSVRRWWDEYLNYPDFRLKEEVYAHHKEWESYRQTFTLEKNQNSYLAMMAKRLSSPLYDLGITLEDAARRIVQNDGSNPYYVRSDQG